MTANSTIVGALIPFVLSMSSVPAAHAATITPVGNLTFSGAFPEPDQMSGVARVGRFLVVGVDEGIALVVLAPTSSPKVFRFQAPAIELPTQGGGEADIEGVAADGNTVFAIGSHSLKRKQVKWNKPYQKNRERLAEVEPEENRDALYRLRLDPESGALQGSIERLSLHQLLKNDAVLGRFSDIPSKENGVDIEGLATDGHHLYVGFRGPVLRGNYVPVMVVDFDAPEAYELRYVTLGGDGIRDLARVQDGFLILTGPVGETAGGAGLYFWDGSDTVPGNDRAAARLLRLGSVPAAKDTKAEGLLIMNESAARYRVLVLYDGVSGGNPTLFDVQKPGR